VSIALQCHAELGQARWSYSKPLRVRWQLECEVKNVSDIRRHFWRVSKWGLGNLNACKKLYQ